MMHVTYKERYNPETSVKTTAYLPIVGSSGHGSI